VTTAGDQGSPAIAPDDGGFTVAWHSEWQDGSGSGVYARRFVDAPDTQIYSGPAWRSATNEATPTFTFVASEEGSSFECRLDEASFQPCSSPHTTEPLPDGPHVFEVRAIDADENRDPSPASRDFTVDTEAPQTQIDAGPSGLTNDTSPTFEFSANDHGASFECRLDSDPFGPCSGPGDSHTPAGELADGPHTFEVRAIDQAANTDPSPASRTFTLDTTATPPGAPQITATDPDSPANDNSPKVRGTLGSGSPTEVKLYRNEDCSGNPDATGTPAEFIGAGITIGVPDDATTPLSAAASESGIDSACSGSIDYTEDSTAPRTQINSGPAGLTNDNSPTFGFSSNEVASFECRLDGGIYSACSSPLTTAPLPDGPHSFEVRATDQAGQTDPSPASRSFTVDTVAPAEPSFTDTVPTSPANDNTPLIRGSAAEGTVRIYTSGDCSGPVSGEGSAASFAAPGIEVSVPDDSTTAFHATAIDAAANPSGCSADSIPYREDSTAPETTIDLGPTGVINDPTPTFAFSSDDPGADFECRLDFGGGYSACTSPHTSRTLSDGNHTFQVRGIDTAANPDPSPASRSFSVDTHAPDTSIDSGPDGPTNDSTPTFTFSSNEAASFDCRLDAGTYSACTSPLTPAPLSDGPHSFEVRATDLGGNRDPSAALRSFTVGTTVPALAAPPPALAASDTVPPKAKLFGKRRQEAGRPIEIKVGCNEDCVVLATGRVVVLGAPHRGAARAARWQKAKFRLRPLARRLSAGQVANLKLRPESRKARRRLRRLVRRGRKAQAKIRVSYRDRAGNVSTARLTIRLRRG
jgi:hypothetical protein